MSAVLLICSLPVSNSGLLFFQVGQHLVYPEKLLTVHLYVVQAKALNGKNSHKFQTRWLYCVECPQYSNRLEAVRYLSQAVYFLHLTMLSQCHVPATEWCQPCYLFAACQFPIQVCFSSKSVSTWFTQNRTSDVFENLGRFLVRSAQPIGMILNWCWW